MGCIKNGFHSFSSPLCGAFPINRDRLRARSATAEPRLSGAALLPSVYAAGGEGGSLVSSPQRSAFQPI